LLLQGIKIFIELNKSHDAKILIYIYSNSVICVANSYTFLGFDKEICHGPNLIHN